MLNFSINLFTRVVTITLMLFWGVGPKLCSRAVRPTSLPTVSRACVLSNSTVCASLGLSKYDRIVDAVRIQAEDFIWDLSPMAFTPIFLPVPWLCPGCIPINIDSSLGFGCWSVRCDPRASEKVNDCRGKRLLFRFVCWTAIECDRISPVNSFDVLTCVLTLLFK